MIYNKYPAKSTAIAPRGEVNLKSELYWVKNSEGEKTSLSKNLWMPDKSAQA